jgi:hypothetical protein
MMLSSAVRVSGILLLSGLLSLRAVEPSKPEAKKPAFDPSKATDGGVGLPSPYDKFIALDQALPKGKIDWSKTYRGTATALDPDAFKDPTVAIPLALGVRIADGVMAVKAKNAELLNQCASDIERLAKKMGISDADLTRARAVRAAANKGEWLQVFLDLGFFQQDIMMKIESGKNPAQGTLLVVGGWLEGARFTVPLVRAHYTPELSNILREPMLVKALIEKIDALPAEVKSNPTVVGVRKILPDLLKIVNIPKNGTISKETLDEMQKLVDQGVKLATRPGK